MTELSAPARLGVFGVGLAVVFAAALGVGRLTGDVAEADQPRATAQERGEGAHGEGAHGEGAHGDVATGAGTAAATGTALSAGGLRLDVATTTLPAARPAQVAFRVLDEDGEPVRSYDLEQGKRMHLVVVRRDLARHTHVHPELAADGTWSVPLTLAAGSYRAVADFATGGERRTLAFDLAVPGTLTVAPLPPPSTTTTDGELRVELERDGQELSFTAYDASGAPVTPEPYLGARGHLVAFRAGDLAYAHVHPSGERGATTSYEAELPGPGTYRLFLELQVDGRVRSFPFTVEVSA
jgi:hypothetical protein